MHQLPGIIPYQHLHHFDLPSQLDRLILRAMLTQLKILTTDGFCLTHSSILNTIDHNHLHQQLLYPDHHHPHIDLSHKPFGPELELKFLEHYHRIIGSAPVVIGYMPTGSNSVYTKGDANAALEVKKLITRVLSTRPELNPLNSPLTIAISRRESVVASGTIYSHHDEKGMSLITAYAGEIHPSIDPDCYHFHRPTGELVKQVIGQQQTYVSRDIYGTWHTSRLSVKDQYQPKIPPQLIRQLGKLVKTISFHSLIETRVNWILNRDRQILLDP